MSMGRVVLGESVVEDRQEDEVEAHSPSKRGRRTAEVGGSQRTTFPAHWLNGLSRGPNVQRAAISTGECCTRTMRSFAHGDSWSHGSWHGDRCMAESQPASLNGKPRKLYVLDLVMRLAYNLIDTLGGGESSSPMYMDDFRGRRRHVRQETGAVGQRREACRGTVRAARHEYVVG